ncbi:MAG: hypothetical protein ACREER_06840, partial [Alphaproteobacteria bacterium]
MRAATSEARRRRARAFAAAKTRAIDGPRAIGGPFGRHGGALGEGFALRPRRLVMRSAERPISIVVELRSVPGRRVMVRLK